MSSHRRVYLIVYLSLIALLFTILAFKIFSHNMSQDLVDSKSLDPLYRRVRILCLVPYDYWHSSTATYVKRTWGQHCNVLLFVSGEPHPELEPFVPRVNISENWPMVRLGLLYAYRHYKDDVDWFLRVEDQSFVVLENLRYMLQNYDPELPIYTGYKLRDTHTNESFVYWKSGYVLSREALRRFSVEAKKPEGKYCMRMEPGFTEDLELNSCMRHVQAVLVNSLDEFGLETFMPVTLNNQFTKGFESLPWLQNMSWNRVQQHTVPISKHAITFQIDYPAEIYNLYYFIYRVKIFGSNTLA